MKTALIVCAALGAVFLCHQAQAAITCKQVRDYVAIYGEPLVLQWARSNGYSERQIDFVRRHCLIRR